MHRYIFLTCIACLLVHPYGGVSELCRPAQPLMLPVRNVTLPGQLLTRGVALSVGSPPQNFALQIDGKTNNTVIYDVTGMCSSDKSPIQCTAINGGAFDENASSSWSAAPDAIIAGAPEEGTRDLSGSHWGKDNLQINSSFQLKEFPLLIPRSHTWFRSSLGLGSNSTILNRLFDGKFIASKTWALFWGWTGAESSSQMDGSVVLGGYDAAKITGANYTDRIRLDQACPTGLVVVVKDITLNLLNGSNPSLFDISGLKPLNMCIEPEYPIITIPGGETRTAFLRYAGPSYTNYSDRKSVGIGFWGEVFPANSVYNGSLTYILASGVKITIPNHQLAVPDYHIGDHGGVTIKNESSRELLVNFLEPPNDHDVPLLGQTFLTSAYLLVDEDQKTFTVWQANATRAQTLVAIGSSPTCTSTPMTNSPSTQKVGSIAGAVVGSLALLGLVGTGVILWRKRRFERQRKVPGMTEAIKKRPPSQFHKPELDTDHPLSELPPDNNVKLDEPRELPA